MRSDCDRVGDETPLLPPIEIEITSTSSLTVASKAEKILDRSNLSSSSKLCTPPNELSEPHCIRQRLSVTDTRSYRIFARYRTTDTRRSIPHRLVCNSSSGAEKFLLGLIAGGLVDGTIDIWNPLALIRFGESAGEATEDVLATAGHCAGTAWNIFKIRKAINPASSVSTGVLNYAAKDSKGKS
ncbi:hypothetical protein CMV_022278 [Castanea mollissima]|uniref:Senescence domain-containing protein n=1 Tax=Castanea mollissima TaxID=60419 RepID=A0A8J4V877_9ROSI|nr:hypothetical protein CMV_022278 [Castanea mollissima]